MKYFGKCLFIDGRFFYVVGKQAALLLAMYVLGESRMAGYY